MMDNILGKLTAGLLEPLEDVEKGLAVLADLVAEAAEWTAEEVAELAQKLVMFAAKIDALQDKLRGVKPVAK